MTTLKRRIGACGVVISLLLVAVTPLLAGAYGTATSYTFTLQGPNVAEATVDIPGTPILAGDTLRLTGAGAFDTSGTASGGGAFTHYRPDGTIVGKGTWDVIDYVSFTPNGGENKGQQAGELLIIISIRDANTGMGFSGLTMKIVSGTSDEGTTLPGLFPNVVAPSQTVFHLIN